MRSKPCCDRLSFIPRSDLVHPTPRAYQALAQKFDGALVRGDSFAVGIIARQSHRNRASWGRVGVSSVTVVGSIAAIDGSSPHC